MCTLEIIILSNLLILQVGARVHLAFFWMCTRTLQLHPRTALINAPHGCSTCTLKTSAPNFCSKEMTIKLQHLFSWKYAPRTPIRRKNKIRHLILTESEMKFGDRCGLELRRVFFSEFDAFEVPRTVDDYFL